jgi:hypothetical protein
MRNILLLFLSALMACAISSCSVLLAMHGHEEDISYVQPGAYRYEIDQRLGAPTYIYSEDGTFKCTYRYVATEPSADRAIMHGALDFFTGFSWEIIGTPIELYLQNHKDRTITIVYRNGQAIAIY